MRSTILALLLVTGLALLAQPAWGQEDEDCTIRSHVKKNGAYKYQYVPYSPMGPPMPPDPPPPDRLDVIKALADYHYPLIVKAKVLSVKTELAERGCSIQTVLQANRIQTIKGQESPEHLSIHMVGGKYKFPEGWATVENIQWGEPFPAPGQTWIFFLTGARFSILNPQAATDKVEVSQNLDEAKGAWRISNGQVYSVLNPEFGPAAELWNGAAEAEFVTEVTRLCGK